ncbi:MAG TPA: hypothetical protein VN025_02265 [Candidatus Dormibacteraeota bacterium]|jgi:hypothetical protein|nr:hypothetical protein [Candidatus Dormibacteraeota bacterium]
MIQTRLIISLLFSLLCAIQVSSQENRNANSIPPRSPVVLLQGYKLDVGKAIDSEWRVIWKAGGLRLDFGQGGYFEDETKRIKKADILWTQEQTIDKQRVRFVYTKSHELMATFPTLNARFKAHIHNQQELADMLLMVVTFNNDWYPVDAASIAPLPQKSK